MVPQTFRWTGRLGPLDLEVSDSTFQPSTISVLLADALEVHQGDEVIDVGCGSGILSIIAAKLGALRVFGMDTAPDVVGVASRNAARHGVAHTVTFLHGDLFAPLSPEVRADVIIGDVSGIPDSLAVESGWFPSRAGGGTAGLGAADPDAPERPGSASAGGRLFLPTGTLQDEGAILRTARALREDHPTHRASDPASPPLAETSALVKLAKEKTVRLAERGSRLVWTARVWECTRRDSEQSPAVTLRRGTQLDGSARFFGEEQPWLQRCRLG